MKYFLIMNPKARGGKSQKLFDLIFTLLNNANIVYDYRITSSIVDAYEFSVYANTEQFDVVVAIGGDGTINAVLNGFYNKNGKKISGSSMGVIYTGTSPDFCKSYNIPINTKRAVQTLIGNNRIKIGIGKLTYSVKNDINFNEQLLNDNQNKEVRYFGCCANIGLGASVARRANNGIRKYLGDFMGTLFSLFITIVKYRANNFYIIKDGVKTTITKLYNLSIGRTKYIASGIKVHNSIGLKERKFYCLVARNFTILNLPGILIKAYSGKKIKNTKLFYLDYITQIEVKGNFKNPEIELDGDPIGYLPCKIELANDYLVLITKKSH